MDSASLKALEAKLTALVEQHKELKARYQIAEQEIERLKHSVGEGDLKGKVDLLLREREDVRQKVENMIKALEDFEE